GRNRADAEDPNVFVRAVAHRSADCDALDAPDPQCHARIGDGRMDAPRLEGCSLTAEAAEADVLELDRFRRSDGTRDLELSGILLVDGFGRTDEPRLEMMCLVAERCKVERA